MHFYNVRQVEPWLYSIYDPLYVYCYLAVGEKKALLYDSVFGIGNLYEVIDRITDKPVTVVLGHAHVDHANGAFQFETVYLDDREMELFSLHTSAEYRKNSYKRLIEAGFMIPHGFDLDTYLCAGISVDELKIMRPGMKFDLGGLVCEVIDMAGHTPGSVGLLFKDRKTLLVSDAANAHMWIFLKESLSIKKYIRMLDRTYRYDFDKFYTGHMKGAQPKDIMMKYKKAALDASMDKAVPYEFNTEHEAYFYEDKESKVGIVFTGDKLR